MVEEYRRVKQVDGLQPVSIYEAMSPLGHFRRLNRRKSSKAITPNALDQFIRKCGREVSRTALNKDISNLAAFLNWAMRIKREGVRTPRFRRQEQPDKNALPRATSV